MCNNHKKTVSRRNFLNILGATSTLPLMQGPAQILIESILMGISQKASALDSTVTPRRYLSITFEGGPPRWVFDHFLTPYDTTVFQANTQVGTKYGGGSTATSSDYATILRKGINVPHMWQFEVPKVGGGTRPMDTLLDNMISIRGVDVGNPDHAAALALQFLPLGATKSISALAADQSDMPIAAVSSGLSQYKFLSTKQKSAVTIATSGNMISTLLTPFTRKDLGAFSIKRQQMSAAIDASVGILNTYANTLHPASGINSKAMSDAKDLLSAGFGDLTTTWTNLRDKYIALITAALDTTKTYAGINDRLIAPDGSVRFIYNTKAIVTMPDIRAMITKSTAITGMAYHFAMAEYILLNNLSSSVSISPSKMTNLTVDGSNHGMDFDEHDMGAMITLQNNFYFNLAYSSCLLELIDRLKAKGIFQDTIISTGGEFSRSARNDGSGSDHGYSGGNTTFYSGAFNGPLVIGNIYKSKSLSTLGDTGTWGYGAPVAELGKTIDLGNLASTTAFLLRTPSPITASSSLLKTSGTSIVSTIEKAKQV